MSRLAARNGQIGVRGEPDSKRRSATVELTAQLVGRDHVRLDGAHGERRIDEQHPLLNSRTPHQSPGTPCRAASKAVPTTEPADAVGEAYRLALVRP